MNKQRHDVRGAQINCVNFDQCPFCYGCRNYNSANLECKECETNPKLNICNVEKHKVEVLNKMIKRTSIKL